MRSRSLWLLCLTLTLASVLLTCAGPAHAATPGGWSVKVSLNTRRVLVLHGRHVAANFIAAVGSPATPTPTGHYHINGHYTFTPGNAAEYAAYGPFLLSINAYKPAGEVAFHHGYGGDYGHAVSEGCIHLTDSEMHWLYDTLPDNTPVTISDAAFQTPAQIAHTRAVARRHRELRAAARARTQAETAARRVVADVFADLQYLASLSL